MFKRGASPSFNKIPLSLSKGKGIKGMGFKESVEGGIRTHGSLLGYTRSPGVPDRPLQHLSTISGGEGGIRTHAPLARRPLFESGTMNHSDTSPQFKVIIPSLLRLG